MRSCSRGSLFSTGKNWWSWIPNSGLLSSKGENKMVRSVKYKLEGFLEQNSDGGLFELGEMMAVGWCSACRTFSF